MEWNVRGIIDVGLVGLKMFVWDYFLIVFFIRNVFVDVYI